MKHVRVARQGERWIYQLDGQAVDGEHAWQAAGDALARPSNNASAIIVAVLSLLGGFFMMAIGSSARAPALAGLGVLAGAGGLALALVIHNRGESARSVRLTYEDVEVPGPPAEAARALRGTTRRWFIDAEMATEDRKRSAGASTSVTRVPLLAGPHSRCRVEGTDAGVFSRARHIVAFLPDRLLIVAPGVNTAVPYEDLTATAGDTRFIERDVVPTDATQVGTTWAFVNKDGGPDRRFRSNPQIPVLLYGELRLRGGRADVLVQTSTVQAARQVAVAVGNSTTLPGVAHADGATEPSPDRPSEASAGKGKELAATAFVLVLKYIAQGDRRLDDRERRTIEEAVQQHFSDVEDAVARARVILAQPHDLDLVHAAVSALRRGTDLPSREHLVTLTRDVALADGKMTPKEKERLAEVERLILNQGA